MYDYHELTMTEATDGWAVVDDGGIRRLMTIPRDIAPDAETADKVLVFVLQQMDDAFAQGRGLGASEGARALQRQLHDLLGTAPKDQVDHLGKAVDRIEQNR